jgi:hypothetical protein
METEKQKSLDINGKIIVKLLFKKYDWRMQTGVIWLSKVKSKAIHVTGLGGL